jgi:hypothetical protein
LSGSDQGQIPAGFLHRYPPRLPVIRFHALFAEFGDFLITGQDTHCHEKGFRAQ